MMKVDSEALKQLRHSAAHILAQAVLKLFPEAKTAIGPAIKEGFYYDFERDQAFTEEDLRRLETEMKRIIAERQPFVYKVISRDEARKIFENQNQPYKLELLESIADHEISIVTNGPFTDLCRGGHASNTGEVGAVKLLSVAGAYWRGDERNKMLQRIYGTAFPTQKELETYLTRLEEAKKRDHRKLGKELDLFSFHEEAPGVPFYHPRGLIIYENLIRYWREEHEKENYLIVKTPMLYKDILWHQSGHYEHYRDNMFFSKVDEDTFAVKPMNCPGHTLIYRNTLRSYRDLPMRMAELGMVHRRELSGVLHGLFRVNAFTIDDAHIFCTEDQIRDEISRVISLILKIYRTFGFEEIHISLSTRPEDSMGTDAMWEKATDGLKAALAANQIEYDLHEGGGAFYGPKIDFEITDSIGREWQCGTIQLDFQMPERFGMTYIDSSNQEKRPVMVHRAVFGSIERFYGVLVEHYGGAFPIWLAPEQVRVMTITDKQQDWAREVCRRLRELGIRAGEDFRPEKIGYKIREAETQKIPYVAVIGDKEVVAGQVSVRGRGRKDLGSFELNAFSAMLQQEIMNRKP